MVRAGVTIVAIASIGCGEFPALQRGDAAVDDAAPPDASLPRAIGLSYVFVHGGQAFYATFSASTEGPGSCIVQDLGSCEIDWCDPMTAPVPPRPHAGELTVAAPGGTSTGAPAADGGYVATGSASWVGGESVTFTAEGGEVPGFTETLTGPADLASIDEPAFGEPVTIALDQPLRVRWTGAAAETVLVVVGYSAGDAQVQLRCFLPGSAGEGEVPAAALARLEPGNAQLSVLTEDRRVVPAGDFEVRLGARGRLFNAPAVLGP
jgi:hypothetical protein